MKRYENSFNLINLLWMGKIRNYENSDGSTVTHVIMGLRESIWRDVELVLVVTRRTLDLDLSLDFEASF